MEGRLTPGRHACFTSCLDKVGKDGESIGTIMSEKSIIIARGRRRIYRGTDAELIYKYILGPSHIG